VDRRNSFANAWRRFRGPSNKNQIAVAFRKRACERHSKPAGGTGYERKPVHISFQFLLRDRRTDSGNRVSNTPSQKRVVMHSPCRSHGGCGGTGDISSSAERGGTWNSKNAAVVKPLFADVALYHTGQHDGRCMRRGQKAWTGAERKDNSRLSSLQRRCHAFPCVPRLMQPATPSAGGCGTKLRRRRVASLRAAFFDSRFPLRRMKKYHCTTTAPVGSTRAMAHHSFLGRRIRYSVPGIGAADPEQELK